MITMKTYACRLKHDTGTIRLLVEATDQESAIHTIMKAEGCPRSAIESITEATPAPTRDQMHSAGKAIAIIFDLKIHAGRYNTTYGTKTEEGIAAMILRLAEDIKAGKEINP